MDLANEELAPSGIVRRWPIEDHDGASGALLEHAELGDGTRLVLKTFDPARDLSMAAAGRVVPVDVELWQSGILDRLPDELGHAVVGAWQEAGNWVVAMRDLSDALLSFESRLTRNEYRRVIAAAAAMHTAFEGVEIASLWPVGERIAVFSSRTMAPFAQTDSPLPGWCLEGWRRWEDLAPADVRELVERIHADPDVLIEPLRRLGPTTLLHGDFWTPNVAFDGDRVVAIDWGLATIGPPVLEFVSFLAGCAEQVDATRDALVEDVAAVLGPSGADAVRLGLVFGVVEMGWNLAWHLADDPSDQRREVFEWWIQAARDAAGTGAFG